MGHVRVCDQKFFCQRMDAAFNVTGSGGAVASEHISKVSLLFDKDALVGQDHKRASDRSVSVRMVLHAFADNVCNFLESAVVHLKKRVHDAALNWLESVFQIRNGAVANYVASVLDKVFVKKIFYECHFISTLKQL